MKRPLVFLACSIVKSNSSTPLYAALPCLRILRNYGIGTRPTGSTFKKKSLGPTQQKVKLPVETDPIKLVNYVCGSDVNKENPQDIKLGPDTDYPDWLWTLRTGKAPSVEDLEPGSKEYWLKLRKESMRHLNKLASLKKF